MNKELIYASVQNAADTIISLSDKIWGFAELSMQEHQTASAYISVLKENGFEVAEHLVGLPTAFLGRYGTGKPVIGILGEFDALSGLSQAAGVCYPDTNCPGSNGHGCGHNLLGAASLGAAIAIKEQIQAGNLSGTIVFYGCPGEEGCAGKVFMARDGMFRDLDAALSWHPGDTNEVVTGSNAASLQVEYTFTGIASHAADAPDHGRSALDAAELMNIGVQFLREHMPQHSSVHYAFTNAGGISPNVVQSTATLVYMVRGENVKCAKALLARVDKIAQGAALMTETAVISRQIDGTSSTLSNTVLEKLLYENLCQAPLPEYSEADHSFAETLKATYSSKSEGVALCTAVTPYAPSTRWSPGSTDLGDVSWLTPTAQFNAVTWPVSIPGHSWQVVSAGKSDIAHKGILFAAKALAGAAAELMEKPELLRAARKEFDISSAGGYDCPITQDIKPI